LSARANRRWWTRRPGQHPGSLAEIAHAEQVDRGIDHRDRCATVERDRCDRVELEAAIAARLEVPSDRARELQDQIGLSAHLAILASREVIVRRNLEPLAVGERSDERDGSVLLADQDVPREAHAVL